MRFTFHSRKQDMETLGQFLREERQKQGKTLEQIAEKTDHLSGLSNIRAINKLYRVQDESDLWPIRSKFNVTERAIRKARIYRNISGAIYGLEYCYLLEDIISNEVNNTKTW